LRYYQLNFNYILNLILLKFMLILFMEKMLLDY